MEGVIVNFRRGRRTQNMLQMVVQPVGSKNRESAAALVGKEVVWKSPAGKPLKGEILSAHGKGGAVRARFETGMPGQAIGSRVHIA